MGTAANRTFARTVGGIKALNASISFVANRRAVGRWAERSAWIQAGALAMRNASSCSVSLAAPNRASSTRSRKRRAVLEAAAREEPSEAQTFLESLRALVAVT